MWRWCNKGADVKSAILKRKYNVFSFEFRSIASLGIANSFERLLNDDGFFHTLFMEEFCRIFSHPMRNFSRIPFILSSKDFLITKFEIFLVTHKFWDFFFFEKFQTPWVVVQK